MLMTNGDAVLMQQSQQRALADAVTKSQAYRLLRCGAAWSDQARRGLPRARPEHREAEMNKDELIALAVQ